MRLGVLLCRERARVGLGVARGTTVRVRRELGSRGLLEEDGGGFDDERADDFTSGRSRGGLYLRTPMH